MSNNFKRITAWLATASLVLGFVMMPTGAAAATVYKYKWVSQTPATVTADGLAHYVSGNQGDTIAMSVTLQNLTGTTIKGITAPVGDVPAGKQVQVGAWGIGVKNDAQTTWADPSSFVVNGNRLGYYYGSDVAPNANFTISWNLKIASTAVSGTYDLRYNLVCEYLAWTRQVAWNGVSLPLNSSDIFTRVIIGGAVTPVTGGLSIALAGDTPVSASIADAGNANFTKFTLTPAAAATVNISQIYVTRDGLSTDSQVENVKILDADGVQIGGTAGGFNANHKAQIYITPAYALTGSKSFYIRAGIVNSTTGGVTIKLGIADNADIISNATSVAGAPIWGNAMTCVQVTIGTVTVAEDWAIPDGTPDVGDKDVDLNPFTITAGSTEPIVIDRITCIKAGTSDVSDTTNIELWDVTHDVSLGTQLSWTGDGKASWPVNISLGKGDMVRLKIRVDIVDGVSLTVNADLLDGSDTLVFAKGGTYGFYITPTSGDSNWTNTNNGQGANVQTINSGALTISKSGLTPATGNIAVANGQLLTVFDFDVKGEAENISAITIYCNINDAGAATFADMTNGRLVDMATGNTLAGPVDGADEADGATTTNLTTAVDAKFAFTSTVSLPVGITKIGFKVRINTTNWVNADTVNAIIDKATDITAKGIITNNTITAGGSYSVTGNTQTIKAGALVIETLGVPATGSVIINAQDMIVGTYSFNAVASGEDVIVTAFTITDTMDGTIAEFDDWANMELWADLDATASPRGDVYETQISSTATPVGNAAASDTEAFTLTKVLTITKGTSTRVALVADLTAGATADGTHIFETSNGACATVNGKDTGSAVTETAAGLSINATLTVAAAGSIATALADSNPDSTLMIAGGSTYTTLGAFRLTATDEPFNVTLLTFDLTGWAVIDKLKISYPTKTGTATREVSPSSAAVTFDGLDMYVPKNGHAVVTGSAIAKRIGSGLGGTYATAITLGLDMDAAAEFAATGENSGSALDGDSSGTTDRNANAMYLYNTIPTITAKNSGTGTIAPGNTLDLYKFDVTADAAGAVAVKRFTFSIFITDASTTTASAADLGGFTFWRGTSDITSTAQITQISTDGGANHLATPLTIETDDTNDLENNTSYWVQVTFANTPATDAAGEQVIEAGQTVSYTLKAVAGTGFTTTDAFSTTLLNDSAVVTADYNYLSDVDSGTGVQQVVILQNAAGTQYGDATMTTTEQTKFLWSDKSVLAHLCTFDDDGVTETSSLDWTNGYLTKNTPGGYGYTL